MGLTRTAPKPFRFAAFFVALATSLALWLEYFPRTYWTTTSTGLQVVSRPLRLPLLDGNHLLPVTFVLGWPVLVSLIPLIDPRLTKYAAIVLAAFAILGSMTIGLFYVPAVVLLFIEASTKRAGE